MTAPVSVFAGLARKPLTDFAAREAQRMLDLGGVNRARSSARARAIFDDSRATQVLESWANLTAWSSQTTQTVSNGRLYGLNASKAPINRALGLGVNDTFRAVTVITTVAGNAGQVIGVNKDAIGAAPAVNLSTSRALIFQNTGQCRMIDNGTYTDLGAYPGSGSWIVTIDADPTGLQITAASLDGLTEYRTTRWARVAGDLNNLFAYNTDPRDLAGGYIGPIGATVGVRSSITPRANIEGIGRTVHNTVVNSKKIKVTLPPNYDARIPSPVMIYFHGASGNEHQFADAASQKAVLTAALAAGYIVVSACDNVYASGFGADAAIECYVLAYQWARDNFNIGPVVFHVNSMGGIESLVTLAQRRIPGVVAWAGTSPTSNLGTAYANATFTASIQGAYGIAGDGSDYAAKTAGHDPMLLDADVFRGLPMMFLHATDDAVIPKATNTDMFKARIAPFALEVIDVAGITGGHSFVVTTAQANAIIAFFNRYTAL